MGSRPFAGIMHLGMASARERRSVDRLRTVRFPIRLKEGVPVMKYGARNTVSGVVKSIQEGDIMSLVKFDVAPCEMASVLTSESLEDMELKVGDKVSLAVKAVNVLPVKE